MCGGQITEDVMLDFQMYRKTLQCFDENRNIISVDQERLKDPLHEHTWWEQRGGGGLGISDLTQQFFLML